MDKKTCYPLYAKAFLCPYIIENGLVLHYIQELLVQSKPETIMIYTHVAKKDLLQIQSPLYKALLGLLEPHIKMIKVIDTKIG